LYYIRVRHRGTFPQSSASFFSSFLPAGPLLDYSLEKDTPAPVRLSGALGELMEEVSLKNQHIGKPSTHSGTLFPSALLSALLTSPLAAIAAVALLLVLPGAVLAQQSNHPAPQLAGQAASQPAAPDKTHITPDQAKQLFALVDELIKFSSDESGLPIKSTVKRQLTTRNAVESYIREKFEEDEGAKRLQKDEIVLKKFGLLDRDFALKPFLLALLKEQVEAFYDAKTKTVNLLDWVDIDEQKPVLAHELTHALQDQRVDLDKWNDQTPDEVSTNSSGDTDHLAKDELDTARDAIVEGQATAVMMDYILKPMGKSLVKDPEIMDMVKGQMASAESSPVLARAPILLSESLLFPYREGLSFEQDVWMDQGQAAAFAGALDHPPTSSWEIINPREFERHGIPAVPLLPNIHPLVDSLYKPYDIGQVGQLDLHILAEIFGGDAAARDLTPAWNGGIYWAGQRKDAATPAEQSQHRFPRPLYLASWKNKPPPRPLPSSTPRSSVANTPASSPILKPAKLQTPISLPALRSRSSPPTKDPWSSPPEASWSLSPRAFPSPCPPADRPHPRRAGHRRFAPGPNPSPDARYPIWLAPQPNLRTVSRPTPRIEPVWKPRPLSFRLRRNEGSCHRNHPRDTLGREQRPPAQGTVPHSSRLHRDEWEGVEPGTSGPRNRPPSPQNKTAPSVLR
jgi:hypothetical protein